MPPGPDGLDTLARLRERGRTTPVIMMSGKAQLTDAVRAVKLGAFQFLEKPLTPEAVLVTVRAALELNRARAENRALQAELARRGDPDRRERRHAAGSRPDRAGRPHRSARPDHRRIGDGQGAGRGRGSRHEPPVGPPVRHGELRRDSSGPGRVRDVRPRARLVHRRDGAPHGPLRAGARRHALPRRDRRPQRGGAGQAAPHARDRRAPADRRGGHGAGGRASHLGDQPPTRGRGGRTAISGRTSTSGSTSFRSTSLRSGSGWRTFPRS